MMSFRDRRARLARRDRADPEARSVHLPALSIGAEAVGTLALAAVAVGALAIGALAIGQLAISRARILHLEIDELVVRRLRIVEQLQTMQDRDSES